MKTVKQIIDEHVARLNRIVEEEHKKVTDRRSYADVLNTHLVANAIHLWAADSLRQAGYDTDDLKTLALINRSIELAHEYAKLAERAGDDAEAAGFDRKEFLKTLMLDVQGRMGR